MEDILSELVIDTSITDQHQLSKIWDVDDESNVKAMSIFIGPRLGHACFGQAAWWTDLFCYFSDLEHLRLARRGNMPGWGRDRQTEKVLVALRQGLELGPVESGRVNNSSNHLSRLATLHLTPIAVQDLVSLRFAGGSVYSDDVESPPNPRFWYRIKRLVIAIQDISVPTWSEQHRLMANLLIQDYLRIYSLWLEQLEWTWLTSRPAAKSRNPLFIDDDMNRKPGDTPRILWRELCTLTFSRTRVTESEMKRLFLARAGMLRKVVIRDDGMEDTASTRKLREAEIDRSWHQQDGKRMEILKRKGESWTFPAWKEVQDDGGKWSLLPIGQ